MADLNFLSFEPLQRLPVLYGPPIQRSHCSHELLVVSKASGEQSHSYKAGYSKGLEVTCQEPNLSLECPRCGQPGLLT